MNSKCREPEHDKCSGCLAWVSSRSDHVHHYRRNPDRCDLLCGECFGITALAAIPVMQAAEQLGLDAGPAALAKALQDLRIAVLTQGVFGYSSGS